MTKLSIDIDELYKKFGLIDDRCISEEQMKAVVSFNNMLTEDILNEVSKKYNVHECREFAELKRKALKYSKKCKLKEHKVLVSFMQAVRDRKTKSKKCV